MLLFNPGLRISAKRALMHPYFDELPDSDENQSETAEIKSESKLGPIKGEVLRDIKQAEFI